MSISNFKEILFLYKELILVYKGILLFESRFYYGDLGKEFMGDVWFICNILGGFYFKVLIVFCIF